MSLYLDPTCWGWKADSCKAGLEMQGVGIPPFLCLLLGACRRQNRHGGATVTVTEPLACSAPRAPPLTPAPRGSGFCDRLCHTGQGPGAETPRSLWKITQLGTRRQGLNPGLRPSLSDVCSPAFNHSPKLAQRNKMLTACRCLPGIRTLRAKPTRPSPSARSTQQNGRHVRGS